LADVSRPVEIPAPPVETGTQPTSERPAVIPERYSVREKDGVRLLECDEAPRVRVLIDPEMAVSRSEAAALGQRVILLDGAGSFGPLIDNEHKLYNLDHHAGCERLFTLSTCEQALMLTQSGLELTEGDWTLYANDPDLDTVLALWCLLNHRRVRELRAEARDVLLPLLRLEGAIDANGLELAQLCGLPSDVFEPTMQRINELHARERALKQSGAWAAKDVHAHTLEMLRAVDVLIYEGEDFGDHTRIDEIYGHVEIAPRQVAVACRDRSGIYTVEQHLKSRWGDQLALIVLENELGVYTLRRVSSVVGPQLERAFERLNRVDAAVDGRPVGKRWGGSQDIGGSPRPHGSQLKPDQVLEVLADAYAPTSWWRRTRQSAGALIAGLSVLLCWPVATTLLSLVPDGTVSTSVQSAQEIALASLLALIVGMLGTRTASHRRPWAFGWRLPASGGGLWLAPIALAGALPVAVWIASSDWNAARSPELPAALGAVGAGMLALAATEAWFRGWVHGVLALDSPVQRPRGPWLLSRAALVSSLAYAAVAATLVASAAPTGWLASLEPSGAGLFGIATTAFAIGLTLAVIRERSLSLIPGIALQLAGLLITSALAAFAL